VKDAVTTPVVLTVHEEAENGDGIGMELYLDSAQKDALKAGINLSRMAAEVIAGHKVFFEPKQIPGIAYTFPEIATAGMSEIEAKEAEVRSCCRFQKYRISSSHWPEIQDSYCSEISEKNNPQHRYLFGDKNIIDEYLEEIRFNIQECNSEEP